MITDLHISNYALIDSIDLTFGVENELWRIIAYSDFMQDTDRKSGV